MIKIQIIYYLLFKIVEANHFPRFSFLVRKYPFASFKKNPCIITLINIQAKTWGQTLFWDNECSSTELSGVCTFVSREFGSWSLSVDIIQFILSTETRKRHVITWEWWGSQSCFLSTSALQCFVLQKEPKMIVTSKSKCYWLLQCFVPLVVWLSLCPANSSYYGALSNKWMSFLWVQQDLDKAYNSPKF